jgi:cytoskeletal protein RodZ
MTCKEIEDLLPGMIDGALPDTDKKRIEKHLESCVSCRKTLAELRLCDERIKRLEEVEPPPWLKTRIMAQVREEARQKKGIFRKLFFPLHVKVPIQALATVLIAFIAWNVYKTGEPEFRQVVPSSKEVREAPQAKAEPGPSPAAGPAKRAESPAAREKTTFAPPPGPGREPSPHRAATVRGETEADAEKPVEHVRAAKSAVEGPKDEDASAGAARPGVADRVMETQARDRKQKAVKAPAGAVAKEAVKQEARPAAQTMLSADAQARPDMEVTLRARDPEYAAAEAETVLSQLGAQAVDRQSREGRVILTARIRTENIEVLRDKLKSIGFVRESVPVAPSPGGSLTIRIEIRPE